jgi:DNA-directed RNA polymerase specialized sigma24 family protein
MADEGSVTGWLHDLRGGDVHAVERLWQRYYSILVDQAQRRMAGRTRIHDGEDVVVDVFASFYQGIEEGRYPQLQDRNDLWALLLTITRNKAAKAVRYEHQQCRGGNRRRQTGPPDDADSSVHDFLDRMMDEKEPTPDFALEAAEECGRLFRLLSSDELCTVARMKMQGYENKEIAARLDLSERSIERKLQLIRLRWENELRAP